MSVLVPNPKERAWEALRSCIGRLVQKTNDADARLKFLSATNTMLSADLTAKEIHALIVALEATYLIGLVEFQRVPDPANK